MNHKYNFLANYGPPEDIQKNLDKASHHPLPLIHPMATQKDHDKATDVAVKMDYEAREASFAKDVNPFLNSRYESTHSVLRGHPNVPSEYINKIIDDGDESKIFDISHHPKLTSDHIDTILKKHNSISGMLSYRKDLKNHHIDAMVKNPPNMYVHEQFLQGEHSKRLTNDQIRFIHHYPNQPESTKSMAKNLLAYRGEDL